MIIGENGFLRNQPFGTPFTLDLNDIYDPYDPGGGDTARLNRTYNLRDTFTWIKGSHSLKFGGEWRQRYVNNRSLFELAPFGVIDFSRTNVRKETRIGEAARLEFRWEVFNAFNNVGFANPATDIFSASFGQIQRTVQTPRLMQFALRLSF